jgi:NOL1/NOP2/fmu family ribosome biogenesis protein
VRKTEAEKLNFRSKNILQITSKKNHLGLKDWIRDNESFDFFQHNEFVYILPKEIVLRANHVMPFLKVVSVGTTIASVKHDKFIPEHALAMSVHLFTENIKNLALNYDDAIKYLRKDSLQPTDEPKGYYLVNFEDTPLGWINHLGTRINNLYPQEWRIRMSL